MYIGPIKATQKGLWCGPGKQTGHNFSPGFLICGGGKGGKGHVERLPQRANFQVIGAKIMPPLADAMCFIYGNQCAANPAQHRHCCAIAQAFRRHVKQFQPPGIQRFEHGFGFFFCVSRGQGASVNTGFAQGAHLIAHQRNQR